MKKLIVFVLLAVIFALSAIPVAAESNRLVDKADLLTAAEEEKLAAILDETSERLKYDIVVIAVDTMQHHDTDGYAAYYAQRTFEHYDYGYGEKKQGALLLISMEYDDFAIYSPDMSDYTVTAIGNDVSPYLSSGDYYDAFVAFAERIEGEVVTSSEFPLLRNIAIAVIVGLVIAFVVVSVMKGKLKTVRSRDHAREYVRAGSFDLQHSRDLYLYSTVTRVPRPRNNSNGGSRGGGGRMSGKF